MLSSFDEFQVLLARYDEDPGVCSIQLRTHSRADPGTFLQYAQRVIPLHPVTRGLKFIAGLAMTDGLIPDLVRAYQRDPNSAVELAKKIAQCDPRIDVVLGDRLLRSNAVPASDDNALSAILDLLEIVSESDRLVPTVRKLMLNPNPKIRSKAALFVSSRTDGVASGVGHNHEFDGRTRANRLESLFGLNSDLVRQIFHSHTEDENNRCRGNAVLGLYLLGDVEAIPLVYDMAQHSEPRFRNTSAWLMGRSGDPRFLPTMAKLMQDSNDVVRSQAFKGMGELKRSLRALTSLPPFQANIAKVDYREGSTTIVATVRDANNQSVRGLKGTAFIVRPGTAAPSLRVSAFGEYECRSSLSVGFILCLPALDDAESEARYIDIAESCVPLRRLNDRWGFAKVSGRLVPSRSLKRRDSASRYDEIRSLMLSPGDTFKPHDSVFSPKFKFSANDQRLNGMVNDHILYFSEGSADDEAQILGDQLCVQIGSCKPNLIFMGAVPPPSLVATFAGRTNQAILHFLPETRTSDITQLQSLAEATGGSCRQVSPENLGSSCRATCSSLLHHYRISSTEIDPANASSIELQITADAGHGKASYQLSESAVDSASPEPVSAA